MKKLIPLCLALIGGAVALACSSSGSNGNSGASCAPAQYQSDATPACTSCVESMCGAQYSNLCSSCNTGSGGSDQNACANAVIAVGECASSKCPVCVPSGGSGGTSS